MVNRKPAGPATKSENRQTLQVVIGAALCLAMLWGSATAQVVVNPVNGHSYEYVRIRGFVNWDQAQFEATERGGYLATVTDSVEVRLVAGLLTAPGQKAFLGATDINDSCDWRWVTDEPFLYTNWASGEPSGEEPCENSLRTSYELHGKWEADVGPLDGWIVEWNHAPIDTLLGLVQWQVSEGGNGHWYARTRRTMTWGEAHALAGTFTQNGVAGHLATVSTPEENDFITQLIMPEVVPWAVSSYAPEFWLGGYAADQWRWITGEPFAYSHFLDSVPFDSGNVIAMRGYSYWMDTTMGFWDGRSPQCDTFPYGCLHAVIEFDTEPTEPRVLYVPDEFPTIQAAIDSARHGDMVLVSPGVYTESITFHGKDITVRASDGPLHTVITNERTVNLVRFQNGETHEAVLEGFTLQGGWIAVLITNSAPTIRHNICVGQNVWNWAAISISGPIDTIVDPTGDPRYSAHLGYAPAIIENNTIVNSTNGGMSMFSITPPTIRNNIVAFNANYGIHQQSLTAQEPPIMGYNDVYGQEENHGTPYGNYINIPDPGLGSISLDPLFDTRPFAACWALSAESPCINAGDPDPAYNDPDGSRNDMGALPYEYGGGVVIPTNEWIVLFCDNYWPDASSDMSSSLIQAFDPDGVLCGQAVRYWQGSYGFMPVYRDDPYTEVDEGCEPGDLVQFKIDGLPVQSDPPVYWTANGDLFEVCSFGQNRCLDIPLHAGWNLISWNVAYEGPIQLMLDEIIGCVDVVLSFEQGGLVFDPNLDMFNTLTHVDYKHAYWVRMNCVAVLQVCGESIPDDEWIPLEPGWNLVSYWPESTLQVEVGFGSIIDSLQMAMGFDQGAQIWLPLNGFSTLTELRPTFGYWAKVPGYMPLFYPDFTDPDTILTTPSSPSAGPVIETSREWMSVYGSDITVDGVPVADGAEFAFYAADDVLCGRGVYSGGRLKLTPVYGWDESGELSKRFPKAGDGLAIRIDGQSVYPDLVWNGASARVKLSRLTTDSKGLPDSYALSQNYPNPFNPQTTIQFEIPSDGHVTLGIFNVLGQEVRTLVNAPMTAGRYHADWDGRGNDGREVSTGVYFYRLVVGETTLSRKMLLLK